MADGGAGADFEGDDGFRRTRHEDEALSTAVVLAVAAATETPADQLPPLASVVDPDALDAIFDPGDDSLRVEFRYAGCRVAIEDPSTVAVWSERG